MKLPTAIPQTLVMLVGVTMSLSLFAQQPPGAVDVVVPVSPDVTWGNGSTTREAENHCLRCCVYGNRGYSEGALLKVEGVVLQCVRDKQTLGNHNLIWQRLKP